MNETIIKNMFSTCKEGDDFYYIGDLSWSKRGYEIVFNAIPKGVNFHWILGNHDLKEWKKYRDRVQSTSELRHIKIKGTTTAICHYPMLTWNKSHYNSWQLFGHHHDNRHGTDILTKLVTGKQLNVNCEFHNYMPWTEDEIEEYMDGRPDNWDRVIK